ncbi:amidohydrolase [Xanthomarina sp. F1114]|uniref:amidohydrolase n=1 Tax=Xanthomarina sp. F1114 TaxID=2996019 RepID=UPI00225E6244|nr:amidohydrolase [Xanthomarina sp. F1114]MCX7548172.1 amidohydrolase [Xanthomarina sp. F1114]
MKKLLSIFVLISILSCSKDKEHVDSIVINANAYTVNSSFDKAEAFAIKNGKFYKIGTSKELQETFEADTIIDAKGQTVFPGFIDAHCHFYGLGTNLQKVDLRGTTSFDEVMKRVLDYQNDKQTDFIIGRGWDQNDWEDKNFPNKKLLDALFPDTPVALTRIDGHALLCNQAALDLAKITKKTKIEGGEIVLENGELTGVLVDNPMGLVYDVFPKPDREFQINALLDAQDICTELGLTTVSDAGLDRNVIELIDSLQQTGDLQMRVYAMVENSKDNLDYFLPKGKIKTDRLNVQSVKVYADGALGSRGAALKAPYSDKENHFGAMVIGLDELESLAKRLEAASFQMNTHAIGDSANSFVLKTYDKILQAKRDRRWRVEHAQIITDNDFEIFKNENIIPSVQPTHATSDMYWAEDRLGAERIKGAYAFKTLLNASGKVALGTDFPIEHVSPLLTFYASVSRQDVDGYPEGGFNIEDGLSREETLKGMTIWAAYANFEDNEKGSIEVGKFADFIILDHDLMTTDLKNIPSTKVEQTYIGGVKQ